MFCLLATSGFDYHPNYSEVIAGHELIVSRMLLPFVQKRHLSHSFYGYSSFPRHVGCILSRQIEIKRTLREIVLVPEFVEHLGSNGQMGASTRVNGAPGFENLPLWGAILIQPTDQNEHRKISQPVTALSGGELRFDLVCRVFPQLVKWNVHGQVDEAEKFLPRHQCNHRAVPTLHLIASLQQLTVTTLDTQNSTRHCTTTNLCTSALQ